MIKFECGHYALCGVGKLCMDCFKKTPEQRLKAELHAPKKKMGRPSYKTEAEKAETLRLRLERTKEHRQMTQAEYFQKRNRLKRCKYGID